MTDKRPIRSVAVPVNPILAPPVFGDLSTTVGSDAGSAKIGAPNRPQPTKGRTVDADGNVVEPHPYATS